MQRNWKSYLGLWIFFLSFNQHLYTKIQDKVKRKGAIIYIAKLF
jgi:hypothetical protein